MVKVRSTTQYIVPFVTGSGVFNMAVCSVQQVPKAGRLLNIHVRSTVPGTPPLSALRLRITVFGPCTYVTPTCTSVTE